MTNDENAIVTIIRQIYIMKKLKTNFFFDNDILNSKRINININKQIIIIENYKNIKIQFNVNNANLQIKRVIRVNEIIKISIRSIFTIFFKLREKNNLLIERDFMFTFSRIERLNSNENVFFHIIDAYTKMIQINNVNSENVYIFKNTRLKFVQKYEKKMLFN